MFSVDLWLGKSEKEEREQTPHSGKRVGEATTTLYREKLASV